MLRHVVMWRFQDEALGLVKPALLDRAKALLLSCAEVVPGIRVFEVALATPGMDCSADLVLHMVLDDEAALLAYQQHPDHVAIKPFMKAAVQERRCMDYFFEP